MMNRLAVARIRLLFVALIPVFLIVGCQKTALRDPAYAPVRPPLPQPRQSHNGAIYQSGYDLRLYEDLRARQIGDLLTIRLVENTDASKSTSTTLDKETTSRIDDPTIFGTSPEFDLPGFFPLQSNQNLGLNSSLHSDHEFKGSGESSQKNSLSGSLTVTVVEVLPNGYLMVRGEKRLTLNTGNEYVRLSGVVRPVDIAADNSVPSTKVADATIVFTGDGQVQDTNVLGWLARFFISAILPF